MNRIVLTLVAVAALMFAAPVAATEKVGLCHRTASDSNPYVYIEVAHAAVDTHLNNGKGHPPKDGRNDYLADNASACEQEVTPSPSPSAASPSPSATPTSEPSYEPSPLPTPDASVEPTTEPSPTPSPEPSASPEPTPEPTQEPSLSPEPSTPASPEPSSETQPSPQVSASPQTTPGFTLPPTDTDSRPKPEPWTRLPLDLMLAAALGAMLIIYTFFQSRRR